MSTPAISVVIPTVGRAQLLGDTLDALIAQDVAPCTFEVIVAIDGSDPGSDRAVLERAGRSDIRLRTINGDGRGQGPARNAGAAIARAPLLLFLDDDIRGAPGLIGAHLEQHEKRDGIAVTGALPVERVDPEPAHYRSLREWWEGEMVEVVRPDHVPSFRDFVTGNVSLPRVRFERVGGFAAVFTGYGREDYELGYRLLCDGLEFVHAPDAVGVHCYRKPVRQWIRQFGTMGRADVRFMRLHPEAAMEIAGLTASFMVPHFGHTQSIAEALAVGLNQRGGRLWARSARHAQIAYYWLGVREEASSPAELQAFISAWRLAMSRAAQARATRRAS